MSADTLGAKIRALPEGQRRGVLFRAIRDAGPSGASCQSVTAMKEAAATNGNPTWNAVCDGTTQWTIVLTVLLALAGLGSIFTAWLGFMVLPLWAVVIGVCLLATKEPAAVEPARETTSV